MVAIIRISPRKKKQIKRRGITEEMIEETVEKGEILFEETDKRFGKKFASRIDFKTKYLYTIWKYDKRGNKIIITSYWRRKKWFGNVKNVG